MTTQGTFSTIQYSDGKNYLTITMDYSDLSKVEPLCKSLHEIYSEHYFYQVIHIVQKLNILLRNINDLNIHKIQSGYFNIHLKNNLTSYFNPNYRLNFLYEVQDENLAIDTSYCTYVDETGDAPDEDQEWSSCTIYELGYFNDEKIISNVFFKELYFKGDDVYEIHYSYNKLYITVHFGEYIQINDEKIQTSDNYYEIDRSCTKQTFWDLESNPSIRKLLPVQWWINKYKLSPCFVKDLFV